MQLSKCNSSGLKELKLLEYNLTYKNAMNRHLQFTCCVVQIKKTGNLVNLRNISEIATFQ